MLRQRVEEHALNLMNRDGIWFSEATPGDLSYPAKGLNALFIIEQFSFWFKHRNDCIRETVQRFIPPSRDFWDIGGGNGFVTKMLQDAGYPAILVEPMATGCHNAKKRGVEHIICSRVEDIGFPGAILPAAGLFDVLEHMEDDRDFLSTMHHFLRHDGVLFITVPAHGYLWSDIDVISGHYRRYSLRRLRRALEETGYRVVHHTFFFRFFSIPMFFLRSIPYLITGRIKDYDSAVIQAQHEHASGNSLLKELLNRNLAREILLLRKSFISHGSSLLVVATPLK